MSRPADIDLGLRIPVEGVQLIEASAGTGKTFTLATLHARLVIESGLPVTQVLAVTFTEAATKELRDRLRERLLLAARLAEGDAADERDESQRLTALLVAAALAREGAERLRGRLRAAAQAMDLAPIHTIHGFCRRVLAEHALEAGEVLGEVELLENERALREEVATDLWRAFSVDAPTHALLRAQWPGPAALARDLRTLVAAERLLPAPVPGDAAAARRRLEAQCADLAAAFAMHGADARAALEAACAGRQLAGNRFRAEWIAPVWDALAAWAPLHPPEADFPEQFARFAQHELAARTAKGKATPASPLFAAIGRWCEARADFDDACEQARIALLHRLRDRARARLAELKRLRAQRGFDDLVGDVAAALAGETGPRLAAALRARWPVALVDEFQDTDPAQWSIFRRIYADAPPPADAGVSALFLIGDPKQAIYRFRGGDVHTYLAAAARADARHALERNFRSRPSVLATVEALFRAGGDEAFAQPGIAFASVAPGGRVADADALDGEVPAPALDVALLDAPEAALAAEEARAVAATACVAAVRALLEGGTRIREGATLRPVRPADIAVLVEKHADAVRIRARLAAAGVPCVAAGRDSLYASAEATQMLCLLEALADVTDDSRLRALLATPWFGLDAAAIAALDAEAAVHRQWQDRVLDWRETLERRGILALVNALCAEAAPRLLRLVDGERRLSNLLQLAEALQEAQPAGTGVMALREALQRRIHEADPDNRTELLRLDSDAARVSIMTVHASKGLEFPFVFLPFVATGGAGRGGPTLAAVAHEDGLRTTTLRCGDAAWTRACAAEAAEERAESLRLLYVALTRARHATWLCWGAVNNVQHTALAWLLHRDAAGGRSAPDAAAIATRLRALAAATPGMRVRPAVDAVPAGRLRLEAPPA
ncbi:UvrD-helicase domain-containing protein, partial [Coralloluteibacterium thermophilus]